LLDRVRRRLSMLDAASALRVDLEQYH